MSVNIHHSDELKNTSLFILNMSPSSVVSVPLYYSYTLYSKSWVLVLDLIHLFQTLKANKHKHINEKIKSVSPSRFALWSLIQHSNAAGTLMDQN